MSVSTGCFHRKQKENRTKRTSLLYNSPPTNCSYRISSNISRPSINRLPLMEILKIIASLEWLPLPRPSRHLLFLLSPSVKLKHKEFQQNWSVTIQALKIYQGTKFGTLEKPMFSLFDFQWATFEIINISLPSNNGLVEEETLAIGQTRLR